MNRTPINVILANNLAHFMEVKGLKQAGLAKLSGVAQRTISNYLRPNDREMSKSGKAPSAKLSEVELIADALGLQPWELLRFMGPSERDFYLQVEDAYRKLLKDAAAAAKAETASKRT
jgi:transcriptional regulator with XRE-family HTH domain